MLRGFRHMLFLSLGAGIVASGIIAWALSPESGVALAICVFGSLLSTWGCYHIARSYLRATLGRLRRVAEDIGHDRPTATLEVQPGADLYKLVSAINLLASRLAEANREEKRLHEQLRHRERLAFLGELAASVAHEINNPLDGVQSCVRILRRSRDNPERTDQMLDLMDNGLSRMHLIVRRLLTLAREHVIRPDVVRMEEVLEGAIGAVREKIESRGIRLERAYEADPDEVSADQPLLEQVFVNLILNAADSMTEGGSLTVRTRREPATAASSIGNDGEGDVVCVDVEDTGHGIPADVMPHIFEPFYTTKHDGKGTGLGLPIAARITDAHSGSIEVQPAASGGTVFSVRLPGMKRPATIGV